MRGTESRSGERNQLWTVLGWWGHAHKLRHKEPSRGPTAAFSVHTGASAVTDVLRSCGTLTGTRGQERGRATTPELYLPIHFYGNPELLKKKKNN